MSLWRETAVKATRKALRCDGCCTPIAAGSPAERVVGINIEGDFIAAVFHPECKVAERELNKLYDLNSDEWVSLSEFDPDDEPYLLAEHPVVAARLGIQTFQAASPTSLPVGGSTPAAVIEADRGEKAQSHE